mmetsp:Transcript_28788/g.73688  ORF Transcript_28788/g.73688 Transcript_28788/m.73688 type:complete len:202 (+) Transcript_28788:222-827(+)
MYPPAMKESLACIELYCPPTMLPLEECSLTTLKTPAATTEQSPLASLYSPPTTAIAAAISPVAGAARFAFPPTAVANSPPAEFSYPTMLPPPNTTHPSLPGWMTDSALPISTFPVTMVKFSLDIASMPLGVIFTLAMSPLTSSPSKSEINTPLLGLSLVRSSIPPVASTANWSSRAVAGDVPSENTKLPAGADAVLPRATE